ncbi:MAG: ComF family protein [Sphingorhabdus sp.]
MSQWSCNQAAFKTARRAGKTIGNILGQDIPKKMPVADSRFGTLSQSTAAAAVKYLGRSGLHIRLVARAFLYDKAWMQSFTQPFKTIVDFALPPRCPSCGIITPDQDQFCAGCWQQLHFLSEPACASCDLPLSFAATDKAQCAACIGRPPRHSGIKAAVAYTNVSRDIALKLKHGGQIGLARLIANMLQRHLHALPHDVLLIPVPLHWTRLWRRRYNQSALIARELARLSDFAHCPDVLLRTKLTKPLGGLSARERAAMVKNVFAVNNRRTAIVKNRPIALVDDIYTSGATSDACIGPLLKAGAASVTIFCWARVLPQALETDIAIQALT